MVDYENFVRLAHYFNAIHMLGNQVSAPMELPANTRHLDCYRANITYSDLAYHCTAIGRGRALDGVNMLAISRGMTLEEVADFLPEVREATLTHSVVNRIEMAIHCPFPGTEKKRPTHDAGLQGFFLAGDWIKTGLPACMESAVQSGFMVAQEVLQRQGRSVELVEESSDIQGFARLVDKVAQQVPGRRLPRWLRPIAGRR